MVTLSYMTVGPVFFNLLISRTASNRRAFHFVVYAVFFFLRQYSQRRVRHASFDRHRASFALFMVPPFSRVRRRAGLR